MSNIVIEECNDSNPIVRLFNEHRDDPFTHLADIYLFRIFSYLKPFRIFVAEINGQVVGCVYAMKYMYSCGWIGGLLVHKRFRRMGIGRMLSEKAIRFLGPGYTYLFVEPENVVARGLYENVGFSAVYRRLNYLIQAPFEKLEGKFRDISYDVEWDELTSAIGFEERGGIVNIGYYPVKVTRHVYEDLKAKRKILRCGNIVAIVENSYSTEINEYTFTFNDYTLRGLPVRPKEKIFEVNLFYIKAEVHDLKSLINHLAADGKITVWTYQDDPIMKRLPLEGTLAALVMELHVC